MLDACSFPVCRGFSAAMQWMRMASASSGPCELCAAMQTEVAARQNPAVSESAGAHRGSGRSSPCSFARMNVCMYLCVYVCMYVRMYISESLGWLTVCEQRGEVFDEEEPLTHVVLLLPQTRPLLGRPRRQRVGLCVAGGREGGLVAYQQRLTIEGASGRDSPHPSTRLSRIAVRKTSISAQKRSTSSGEKRAEVLRRLHITHLPNDCIHECIHTYIYHK